jgi:hypothetical protein
MSEFFKNKNTSEFGPAPSDEVSWLVIENSLDLQQISRYCVVNAKTYYLAMQEAQKKIPDLNMSTSHVFSNIKEIK